MMNRMNLTAILLALLPAFSTVFAGPESQNADRTEAPYFFVQSDDPALDQLPLKATRSEVSITGVIADVIITQVYQNNGSRPLEAVYIFPASTRAAVYKLRMKIGTRIIEAKIAEREAARQEYETAKQNGYSASLLEQQRPNVFQMNIANIMPGDTIEVELRYTELLIPEEQEYAFVLPTVTGPRYANENNTEGWVANPYLGEGEKPSYTFDIVVHLSAGMPIRQMVCTSHRTRIDYISETEADVRLDPHEKNGGDRDFILRYRLNGDRIGNGLMLYRGEKENFFLLMVQPPARIKPENIPAREYIFIVDVSGSMHGFPLEISKTLIRDLVRNLRSQDYFNVLLFAGGSSLLSHKSLPANTENINRALDLIDRQTGGGGTEILPALQQAMALPGTGDISRTIVIATDGYVNVEKETFDLIRNNLNQANVFAFGIGSSVNRFLIEGLARAGQGEPFIVSEFGEAAATADRFRKYIEAPVLTKISYDIRNFAAYDVEPKKIPDLFAERPILVYGKWKGDVEGEIKVTGNTAGGSKLDLVTNVGKFEALPEHGALRYLWARNRIAVLSDYIRVDQDKEAQLEVTNLGLTYNLLTEFTSFLGVDSEKRNTTGEVVSVKQPLPLPRGVSGYAVGTAFAGARGMQKAVAFESLGSLDAAAENTRPQTQKSGITIGAVIGSDGADSLAVRYFTRNHVADLEKCLRKVLTNGSKGKIMLLLIIEPDGTCSKASVIHHTLSGSQFSKCLIGNFYRTKFTGNWPGKTCKVTLELIIN
jgi:Ca-activated chloride channel family protein